MKSVISNRIITFVVPLILLSSQLKYFVQGQLVMNSDSDQYSDDVYRQLASEYDYEEARTTRKPKPSRAMTRYSEDYDSVNSSDDNSYASESDENNMSKTTGKESYPDAIKRLECNKPWFWNAFKCLWLDVRKRNYVPRTKSNAITVAWILGPPVIILLGFLLSFCVVACYLRARVKQIEKKINDLRKTYEPGSIKLDDGRIKKYVPTEEEISAFENLFSTLISVV